MKVPVDEPGCFNNHLSFSSQTCRNALCIFTVTHLKKDYLHAETIEAIRTDAFGNGN